MDTMNTIDTTAYDAEWMRGRGADLLLPRRDDRPPHAPAAREISDTFDTAAHLARRRAELQHRLEELSADLSEPVVGSNHLVEDAGDHQHRRSSAVVAAILLDELRQVERALRRIVTGEYAVCEVCGDQIPPRRLQILPATTLCVGCQARREASGA
jgi:RNA polymerase-binding transcription factor DksA